MKKCMYLIPVVMGVLVSCTGGTKQNESLESLQQRTETIEGSTQALDSTIQNSEIEMEQTQHELDSLLNEI